MTPPTRERLYGFGAAFEDPTTVGMVVAVAIAVGLAPIALRLLARAGKVGGPLEEEIRRRYRSWLVLIPLIAGLAYEIIRFSARHLKNPVCKVLVRPGMWLQRITTKEPDDKQLEIAIIALKEALLYDAVEPEQAAVA